ncbi:MAG: AAA family ATPase, partial [Lachnospiraceae bacterium]
MLISLYVKNLALIDEIELFFDRGLNILTGETGAGKSILMGSIHLALGGKADTNIIRNGKEFALIELLFEVNKEEQKRVIKEFDIPLEEDTLLIQRKILANRSVCKVNGESVSNKQLKELASTFINIHGQHENQSLLKGKTYLDILDDFAIEEVGEYKKSVSEYYKLYKEISKQLEESCMDEKEKNRQINLAEYEVNEIEDAKLKDGEDFLLEEQYKKMVYSQKIVDILSGIYKMVGGDNEHSISNLIGKSLRDIKSISELDTQITTFEEQLITIEEFSFEFIREISNYLESLEYESEALSEVEQRLNVINHLKSKYGNSISEVLLYKEKQESLLSNLKNQDINRKKLEEKLLNVKDKLWKKAKK